MGATTKTLSAFPNYGNCDAKPLLDELARLLSSDLFDTEYIDAKAAAKLVAAGIQAYQPCLSSPRWKTSATLKQLASHKRTINFVCAALFDLVCNAEYLHGRVTNRSWIYCHRHRDKRSSPVHAYFSFLKQCPKCCQDIGLEPRLSGAQHKPSSHHIGEITTTATALFLTLLGQSVSRPLSVGVISKQSHDVDALAWRDDLLVLFEIKSSPLVTYPLRVKLAAPHTEPGDQGPVEMEQHKLIDVDYHAQSLGLYLANRDVEIPLGPPKGKAWPYPQLTTFISRADGLLDYLEAWGEIFLGYRVPKVDRTGREIIMGYLANGWGDEIDSNKTKAGLGRTDDIKKGTYQLLKFGAYYRDGSPKLPIRGVLATNLDPLFMYADYMEKLVDARWAPASKFHTATGKAGYRQILERDLFYIYDSILAFNRPVINDSLLADCFDFDALATALKRGRLTALLRSWS